MTRADFDRAIGLVFSGSQAHQVCKEYIKSLEAELETLQQPKSCDDCRSKSCSIKRILLELGEINSSYFYCNDYEAKEQWDDTRRLWYDL